MSVESHKHEFTPVKELQQIKTLLETLDFKLNDFHQVLPRLDTRRGLVDIGGTVLKTIFGTATISDVQSLHGVINELKQRTSDITHSLTNQLMYVKDLSTSSKVNAGAIANLSSILKDQIVQSHDKLQQIARDIMWLNVILQDQGTMFMHVKQLEFILLHLAQQVESLFSAVQYAIQGKLSIQLFNPVVFHNILRKVTLQLTGGYELIAGTSIANIHLILNVPFKSANRQFSLFKIVTLPFQILPNKFVQYSVDYAYFGFRHSPQGYILLTEASFSHCVKGAITVCPADVAVYITQTLICAASLYFKTGATHQLCRRNLLMNHAPFLQRHGTLWLFHFPTPSQVALRCAKAGDQMLRTLSLEGTGLIHNATVCSISTADLRVLS
jgi:hypothetical protein